MKKAISTILLLAVLLTSLGAFADEVVPDYTVSIRVMRPDGGYTSRSYGSVPNSVSDKSEVIKVVNTTAMGMILQILLFCVTEPVVGMNKNIKHGSERFNTPEKASTSASQSRYVVT